MQLSGQAAIILNSRRTYVLLWMVLCTVVSLLFLLNLPIASGDHYTYMNYVKGFQQGRYTYWYFMDEYIPDTFRNPGYPLFLYLLSFIHESFYFVKLVQLILLFASVYLMLKVIEKYDHGFRLKNLFIILLIINYVVLSYAALIYPETLMLFLITLIVYVEIKVPKNSWFKIMVLAVLYGICFQVRPVILFIPFARFAYFLFSRDNLSLGKNGAFIIIFILSLLPYGFWNLKHHNVFKITPLEGGGGAMYLGYWSPKMVNHTADRYWKNTTYKDAFLNFADETETAYNIQLFNREWDSIENVCSKFLTAKDAVLIEQMKGHPELFVTHNSVYTIKREKLLKELAVKHYTADLWYTVKLKVYTFFRLWYTGLSLSKYSLQNNTEFVKMVLTFITTFFTFLLFTGYFLYCLIKKRYILKEILFPLSLCFYFTIFHLPFVIQARYTTPVRFLFLFSLGYMIYQLHFRNKTEHELQQNI